MVKVVRPARMATYIRLRLCALSPHPVVAASVDESMKTYDTEYLDALSDEMLEVLQQAQPAHVVRADNTEQTGYLFFAGWQLFHELRRRGKSTVHAVIHTTPPPDLGEWAAMAELGLSSAAVAKARSPEGAYHLLSRNRGLWRKVFSDARPRTPATALERLCGISRSAAQRIASSEISAPQQSLLEKMLGRSHEGRHR